MTITRREFVTDAAVAAGAAAALGTVGTALAEGSAADGTYTASAQGRNGLVPVTVTIEGGAIAAVEVGENIETDVFTVDAIPALAAKIVENNSYNVDGISGATWTSAAIKTAVRMCVEEAGGGEEYGIAPEVVPGEDESAEYDVVVVGGGMSGLVSALRATEEGCTVALLDKVGVLGGCSLQSFGAAIYSGDEAIQERFYAWIQDQHYMVDTSLLKRNLNENLSAIEYVAAHNEAGVFVSPESPFLVTYMDRLPIIANWCGIVEAGGGHIYLEATAKELIVEDGAVVGVVAEKRDGSKLTVSAKSVVLATGGFGGDTERVRELSGFNVVCGCLTQCIGEGMDMAYAIGAKVPKNLGGLQLHQTLATANLVQYPYFQMRMPMIMGYVSSVLDVTKAGVRFRDETWKNVATAASTGGAFVGGITYTLVDQSMIDKLMSGGTLAIGFDRSPGMPPEYKPQFEPDTPWDDFDKVLEDMVAGGWGFKGETIEELAVNAGMDPAVLADTFEKYNQYCADGFDPDFLKAPELLTPYEYGPYYLIEITYNQLGTVTGLVINNKMQVLDVDEKPIPGLFSTGAEAFGVLWDHNYNGGGDCIAWAITSGYMGGYEAAAYAKM